MSKDIRSFFAPKKTQSVPPAPKQERKKERRAIILSDDEDDFVPASPVVKEDKVKKTSNKRRILDNSDEEDVSPKKSKSDTAKQPKTKQQIKTVQKSPKKAEKLKEVRVNNIFSSAPVKRQAVENDKNKDAQKKEKSKEEKTGKVVNSELNINNGKKENLKEEQTEKVVLKSERGIHTQKKEKPREEKIEKVVKPELDVRSQKKEKPKEEKVVKPELDVHSDEEFEKTLIEIDEQESPPKKASSLKNDIDKSSSKKEAVISKSPRKKTDELTAISRLSPRKSKVVETKPTPEKPKTVPEKPKPSPRTPTASLPSMKLENAKKKRDYSEFLDVKTEPNHSEKDTHQSSFADGSSSQKNKRRKVDHDDSQNESVLSDEERFERKRHSAILYQKYLNRSGPKHHGAKEIPEGSKDCLAGLVFVITGVLDSLERDEAAEIITKYGGKVNSGVTGKVTHILYGDEAGPAKLAKAEKLKIPALLEDDFLELIRTKSKPASKIEKKEARESIKKETTPKKSIKEEKASKCEPEPKSVKKSPRKSKFSALKEIKVEPVALKKITVEPERTAEKSENKEKLENGPSINGLPGKSSDIPKTPSRVTSKLTPDTASLAWVDKYKPQSVKQIIGQHGDASNVKKLTTWLMKWYHNRKLKLPKPSLWAKSDDGGYYKAALLSGPPGVGKTTSVALVCKELGFDIVEFNASDTRSKTLIKEQISELLTTNSLAGYAQGNNGKGAVTKKHVLVMDEVDGMAGNEDRGGLQELISLIKISSVPIICMCNDRDSPKMRSLVNYCFDLRFQRPRVEQIKSAVMSICFKEGVKITADAVTQLIVGANQDIRQTLHLLSMWSAADKNMSIDSVNRDSKNARKDKKLGPWEVIRKVFSAEEHKTMSIHDKNDLFFHDYSISPLFVQENYLLASPHCPKNEVLNRFARAADSISCGDIVDAAIRGNSAWNLLPVQAMFSSVIPGSVLSGHLAGQIQFPSWLGKNSRKNKLQRFSQELHSHTRLSTSGSKQAIVLDYAPHLRDAIVMPLVRNKVDGIPSSVTAMQTYHLLREDLDSLTELSLWPGQRDPMLMVDSKVKAAMTRTFNKESAPLPYAPAAVKKSKSTISAEDAEYIGDDEDVVEENEDSDPENDALIKKSKTKPQKDSAKEKPIASLSKNKSKDGKGKSKSKK